MQVLIQTGRMHLLQAQALRVNGCGNSAVMEPSDATSETPDAA